MKKMTVIMMVMGIAAGAMAEGGSRSVSLDAVNAYVFRGSTLNDGFVLQPGGEVGFSGFSAGVWANYDVSDYDGALDDNKFSEVDLYGSCSIPVEFIDASVGYTAYIYPLDSTDADHEISLSLGLDVILAPSIGVFYGVGGGIKESLYIEVGIGHEVELAEDLSAECGIAIGYLDPEEGDSGFSHSDISIGMSYKAFSASVTYVAQIDEDVLPNVDDGGSYDAEVIAMVGVNQAF